MGNRVEEVLKDCAKVFGYRGYYSEDDYDQQTRLRVNALMKLVIWLIYRRYKVSYEERSLLTRISDDIASE